VKFRCDARLKKDELFARLSEVVVHDFGTLRAYRHKCDVVKESAEERERERERERARERERERPDELSFRCMQMRTARGVLARVVWRFNADWTTADSAAVRLPRLSLRPCVL